MLPSSVVLVALLLSSAAPQFARPFVRAEQVPGTLIAAEGGRITVLDARDEKAFRRGHLEGAVRVDWTQLRRGVLARRLPAREGRLPEDLDELARDFAALGVDAERPVLVCGAGSSGWGEEGRIAWMLRYLGHKDVAVLDGGCQAWGRAGRPLVRTLTRPSRGRFLARPDEDLRASLAEVDRKSVV